MILDIFLLVFSGPTISHGRDALPDISPVALGGRESLPKSRFLAFSIVSIAPSTFLSEIQWY